jgi:Protein of unknown function (DUF4232)
MRAALRTFVIGAIVLNVGGLGPLNSAAHAHAAPAVGVQRALYRHAGVTSDATSGQARTRSLQSRAPTAPTCQAAQLAIAQDLSSGATGHIGIELRLHNISTQPCTLKGYATIVLLDGSRRPLLTVLRWGPGGFFNFNRPVRLVTLAPGGNAYLAMGWTHIPEPGQTCPRAPNLLILPPGASGALLVAVGHGAAHAYGVVDACGGQLSVSAVEPTHFML